MEGTTLGPYRILQKIGAGGMGEVWLAEDSRLHRQVAIKVLPAEFAEDTERLSRFEQEARAAAALNHPNIAAVFDVGAEGSIHYFVQEYLQGSTLTERLEQATPSLERTLSISIEVARALSAAGRVGVVHRDLKPDNVFLTEDGHAKVLDFGLAKITEIDGLSPDDDDSPTQLATTVGSLMGTAGYMAPEQVECRAVDPRTDIFAFGCLLYEMVSGERAFGGDSAIQTLNRIVHEQPRPLSEFLAAPAELQRIVGKCLAKSPRQRYQSAADLVIDLEVLEGRLKAGGPTPEAGVRAASGSETSMRSPVEDGDLPAGVGAAAGRRLPLIAAVAVALLAVLMGLWIGRQSREGARVPEPTHVSLVERIAARNDPTHAISPDGRQVVYAGESHWRTPQRDEIETGLFLRDLGDPEPRRLPDTATAHSPFFSPDGEWVGFFNDEDRTLRRVSLVTGDLVVVSRAVGGHRGATWTDDDTILFATFEGGIGSVSAAGGEPRLVARPQSSAGELRFPRYLPGGGDVLVTIVKPAATEGGARTSVGVLNASDGEVTEVLDAAADARYLDPGYLLFRRREAIHAVAFDLETRAVTGAPRELIPEVAITADGPLEYDASRSGTILYVRPAEYPVRDKLRVIAVDRRSNETPITDQLGAYVAVRASPRGSRVAIQVGDPGRRATEVWLYDLSSGTRAPLSSDLRIHHPIWSRDGEWLAATAESGGTDWLVTLLRADLSGESRRVAGARAADAPTSVDFGPDDRTILIQELTRRERVLELDRDGEAPPRVVTDGVLQFGPTLSPDGRWLAFTTVEAAETQIYVIELATGRRWPVSPSGGETVRWRGDSRELYYWNEGGLYAVPVRADEEGWKQGAPELILTGDYRLHADNLVSWDVAPDGESFYLVRDEGPPGWQPTRVELVLNGRELVEEALAAER